MDDKQLVAMQKVVEALGGLDEADLRVVLGFIGMRYGGLKVPPTSAGSGPNDAGPANGNGATLTPGTFTAFHDLYHAANPETESEKALVAGYWVQVCQQNDGFDSFTANSALKGMGYTVSNITRALDALMAQEPKYVMQIKKTGTSRQARKVYKLTTAGLKRVAEMLNTPQD
ncbi:MAG: hypothetical protein KF787_00600 [Phycisphaeraceae bacterium]|nr:hypothetical protein [Phycisphaerae bacterium]MBX3391122.1 hypothetical protein [Phycisphaeraceae bacterium]